MGLRRARASAKVDSATGESLEPLLTELNVDDPLLTCHRCMSTLFHESITTLQGHRITLWCNASHTPKWHFDLLVCKGLFWRPGRRVACVTRQTFRRALRTSFRSLGGKGYKIPKARCKAHVLHPIRDSGTVCITVTELHFVIAQYGAALPSQFLVHVWTLCCIATVVDPFEKKSLNARTL